jgi:hypothetical protein
MRLTMIRFLCLLQPDAGFVSVSLDRLDLLPGLDQLQNLGTDICIDFDPEMLEYPPTRHARSDQSVRQVTDPLLCCRVSGLPGNRSLRT